MTMDVMDTPRRLYRFSMRYALEEQGLTEEDLRLPLVRDGMDHSLVPGVPAVDLAELAVNGMLFEYHSDDHMFDGSVKIKVIRLY